MQTKSILTVSIAILFIAMSIKAQVKSNSPAKPQAKNAGSETKTFGSFTDSRDGKTYKTVKIGTQTWMAENLAYKAANGCNAYENDKKKARMYGYLYTWTAAVNACPAGWHLPSDDEWTILENYLGGDSIAGGKMKESGLTNWNNPNTVTSNSSGFTALPGGYSFGGRFTNVGYGAGFWWSAAESGVSAWPRYLYYMEARVYRTAYNKSYGFSVRCIKD